METDMEMVSADEARAMGPNLAAAEAVRLARTVIALHAILDGRTTPPTDAELAAHAAAGGLWRVAYVIGDPALCGDGLGWEAAARLRSLHLPGHSYRWWALDAHRVPRAWPEVSR